LALLLGNRLIVRLHRRRNPHIAICGDWPADGEVGRAAVVDVGKLSAVGAGNVLILELCPHGRGMLLVERRQLRGSGAHLHTARSSVETHAGAAIVIADGAVVDVVHH